MENNELTGIERQLVLQYLMDANVPVTLTLVEEKKEDEPASSNINERNQKIKKAWSGVFPVALPPEQLTVLGQGIILLQNPPQSVQDFNGKKVRVQFYFNRLGLYFVTQVKTVKSGLALVIPQVINKVEEQVKHKNEIFKALLYYSKKAEENSLKCTVSDEYPPLAVPKWSEVEEENQQTAKKYLEQFVMQCRTDNKSIGNGLHLIRVVNYLSKAAQKNETSIEGRKNPPAVIYTDEQRIVFAGEESEVFLKKGLDYSVLLAFPIPSGPIKERTVYIDFTVENVFCDKDESKFCAVCRYTKIKEEDSRYLEDKKY